jgi:hypothetical protein
VLATGDLVATLELDDPTRVQRATFFSGQLPRMKQPRTYGSKPHQLVRFNLTAIANGLVGYAPLTSSPFWQRTTDYRIVVLARQISYSGSGQCGRRLVHLPALPCAACS